MALEQIFAQLQSFGVYDVLLPFVLVFTVVFAVLQKTHLFEEKRFNVMIALVMAASTIFPHVLWGISDTTDGMLSNGLVDVVEIMNNSLPNVSVVVVAVLMALIILGVMGNRVELGNNSLSGWIAILAFGVILFIFGNAAGWWYRPGWLEFLDNPDVMALVIVVLVFAIIIWFITKEDKQHETGMWNKVGDSFAGLLKGGGGGGAGGHH